MGGGKEDDENQENEQNVLDVVEEQKDEGVKNIFV